MGFVCPALGEAGSVVIGLTSTLASPPLPPASPLLSIPIRHSLSPSQVLGTYGAITEVINTYSGQKLTAFSCADNSV